MYAGGKAPCMSGSRRSESCEAAWAAAGGMKAIYEEE